MQQSTVLIISIAIVSLLILSVTFIINRANSTPQPTTILSGQSHRMVSLKDIKLFTDTFGKKLNNPNNLLYPEILTKLPAGALSRITVSTMQDTNILVDIILSKISLSSINQLKMLKPEVIMAINPFQLYLLDEKLRGNGDFAPLKELVQSGTLSEKQAQAFINTVNLSEVTPEQSNPPINPGFAPQIDG